MATYVLVHGSWCGGWCWRAVAPRLRAAGHTVFTPTLTGLGERLHLAHRGVGLDTHVEDIVNLLEFEDVPPVILVGHSYGGMVITGVAGRRPELIGRLVFLDAFMPAAGQCAFDFIPDARPQFEAAARMAGDGWLVPPLEPRHLGVTNAADTAWMQDRLTPMPILTHQQPVAIPNPVAHTLPRTFIRCTGFNAFARTADQARAQGWEYHELATGHAAMVTAPAELAALLLMMRDA